MTVINLSHLVPSLTNSSEAATNTVSVAPAFAPVGSESESTHGVPAGTPGPVIPPVMPVSTVHPSGVPRGDSVWHHADGSVWETT